MSYFEDQDELAMELGMGPFDGSPEMDEAIYEEAAVQALGVSDDDDNDWADMKEESKLRRASNREKSAGILEDKGIQFEEKNDGAHLIVRHEKKIVDFWPGTGKWSVRGTGIYKRGVFELLKELGVQ